jgi:ribose transport system substrate-binding protein
MFERRKLNLPTHARSVMADRPVRRLHPAGVGLKVAAACLGVAMVLAFSVQPSAVAAPSPAAHLPAAAITKAPRLSGSTSLASRLAADFVGTEGALPKSGPKPVAGKNVWVISCGQQAVGCSDPAGAAAAAGKLIGWKTTIYDGKLSPVGWEAGIRAAIADHADGIITVELDCASVKQALQEAKAAHIPTIGMNAFDCAAQGAGPNLFTATVKYTPKYSGPAQFEKELGVMQADWLASRVGPHGRILELKDIGTIIISTANAGFESQIKIDCPACTVIPVTFTLEDAATGALATRLSAALEKNPNINGIEAPIDSIVAQFLGPADSQISDLSKISVIGGEGFAVNIDKARTGQWENAGVGNDDQWLGWAGVDALNRVFAHTPQVYSGWGMRLWQIKPPRNLPPTGSNYEAKSSWMANYKRIWGVAGASGS